MMHTSKIHEKFPSVRKKIFICRIDQVKKNSMPVSNKSKKINKFLSH